MYIRYLYSASLADSAMHPRKAVEGSKEIYVCKFCEKSSVRSYRQQHCYPVHLSPIVSGSQACGMRRDTHYYRPRSQCGTASGPRGQSGEGHDSSWRNVQAEWQGEPSVNASFGSYIFVITTVSLKPGSTERSIVTIPELPGHTNSPHNPSSRCLRQRKPHLGISLHAYAGAWYYRYCPRGISRTGCHGTNNSQVIPVEVHVCA